MTDNVTEHPKQGKSPMDAAVNKLREGLTKQYQQRIDDQVKKTLDAVKIARNEKLTLQGLLQEAEQEKQTLKELIGDVSDV